MILSISIAVIICIGLPVSGLIITSKQLSRREADYQLLRKHYTDKFFRLEELEEIHDSMTRARDLWEDKYRKLKVDYKELREKHDSVVKDFDDYHRRVMDEEARQHDSKLLVELNPDYWDCECESHYIHEREEVEFCGRCVTHHSDQPDSIQSEVDKILKAEKVRAELDAIKESCAPIYEDIAEWESKKL